MTASASADEFKARIGFAAAARAASSNVPVKDFERLRPLMVEIVGADPLSDSVLVNEPGAVMRAWRWRSDAGELAVDVTVVRAGGGAAKELVVSSASLTMMARIPFDKGPNGLGDFSVEALHPEAREWIWARGNVCVRVSDRRRGDGDRGLADAIDRFLKDSPAYETSPPRIAAVDVEPRTVKVGQEVRVTVRVAQTPESTRWQANIGPAHGRLSVSDASDWETRYEADSAGRETVVIEVYDPRTLQSDGKTVDVDIVP